MISEAAVNLGVVGLICLSLIVYLIKFVYKYKHEYESNPLCTFSVIFGLLLVLVITCILPVDIFLVSFVKYPSGEFKEWATKETLDKIDDVMFKAYYTLYGMTITFIFLALPFLYFFNDETSSNSRERFHTSIKFTIGSFLLMVVLLFAGAFIRAEKLGPNDIFEKIVHANEETKFQGSITFVLVLMTIIGFINVSFYTASGIFSWPIGMVLGTSSVSSRYESVSDRTDLLRLQVSTLKQKARVEGLSQREQQQLDHAEDELLQLDREELLLAEKRSSWSYKLKIAIRPIQIISGITFGSLSLVILATLIIVNVDRILHSAGPKQGYILPETTFFNPLEYIFTKSQNLVFIGPLPLLITVCFLVIATISGIRNLGLWFMLARLYRVRIKRTPPQALLYCCMAMMLAALSFNLLLYSMSSRYITFGNQNYVSHSSGNSTESKPCTIADYQPECLLTRTSILLMRMMSQLWLFGAIFYWSSWIFVAISGVSLLAYIYRGRRQPAHDLMECDDAFEE